MKKMLFLFQAEKMTKVLVLSVAFFFVGLAGINAQYIGADDAIITLKEKLETLKSDFDNAPSNTVRQDVAFKYRYFSVVLEDIDNGNEIGAAIHENAPSNKPLYHSSGLIAFTNEHPDFRQERDALVLYLDDLLSE